MATTEDRTSGRREETLTQRTAWILCAKLLGFASTFALPLLLVRRLNQAEFGLYKQAFLVVGTAITLLPLGFGMTVYYFFPRHPLRRPAIIFNILLFYLAVGGAAFLVMLVAPDLLGAALVSSDVAARQPAIRAELVALSPLVGGVIFFWLFSLFLESVAIANEETRHAGVFIVLAQVTKAMLLLTAAVVFGTVRSLLYAALIQGIVQTCVLLGYLQSRFPGFWRSFEWSLLKRQVLYAAPYTVSGIVWSIQGDMHHYLVSHYFGPVAFAIYAVGVFQIPLIGLLTESVASMMIPRVSHLQSVGDTGEVIRLAAAAIRKLAMVFLPAYAFLMVAGRELIVVLFTERYLASWPIFAINLTLLPFSIVPLDSISRGYVVLGAFITKMRIVSLILLACGLWLATRSGDLRAVVAVATVIFAAENMIGAYKAARILGVKRRDAVLLNNVATLLLASGLAALITAGTRQLVIGSGIGPFLTLGVEAAVFGLSYLLSFLALGIATEQEMRMIRTRLRTLVARLGPKRPIALDG